MKYKLKRIDKYIIKQFLGTYVFAIILIISISVVFDINEKIDKFLQPNVPLKAIVMDYYMNFVPYFANLFSPLFTFIAVIFFTSKLADNSEIIAMLASGMSFRRLMMPYAVSAAIIAIVTFTLNSFIIPPANLFSPLFTFIAVIFFTSKLADNSEIIAMLASGMSFRRLMMPYAVSAAIIAIVTFTLNSFIIPPANNTRIDFQNKFIKNKEMTYAKNVQLEVEPGVFAYFDRYEARSNMGYRFSLEHFKDKKLISRLTANSIKYDSLYTWTVIDYMIRDFKGMKETIRSGSRQDTTLTIVPSDFLISVNDCETMTTPELNVYINRQKKRGIGNIQTFQIEYHKRFATVMAAFILTTIGAALSSRKIKGGMGLNIGIGLALSFSYILFMTVTSTFAINGYVSPMVAAWIPNVIYTVIAIFLYRRAPR